MKVYETVEVPATTREVCTHRSCDLCGITSRGEDWRGGTYEVNETTVKVEIVGEFGEAYPEGGSKTVYDIDLCPACFRDKLIPALEALGVKVEPREVDW